MDLVKKAGLEYLLRDASSKGGDQAETSAKDAVSESLSLDFKV
eukprot:CAMPEP_0185599268 /NCGR_PEP_ID=MMETSP0434-20130131/82576_1 /TAXON_ID=626734 ORGANISM="Favella taraikaensis, Strain Fe Narragansett Bay" /NCGR_SAMPLE_ID=MMETSP0434 /ASSEMBLY_ACC=CAM_ASM_000379 /LENGTH=42 /DNA_ID= /DNA_START= /DNA_END= /DNA_ORIENTATION=